MMRLFDLLLQLPFPIATKNSKEEDAIFFSKIAKIWKESQTDADDLSQAERIDLFRKILQKQDGYSAIQIERLCVSFNAYLLFSTMLAEHRQLMAKKWHEKNNSPLTGDDILPLCIELVPNDKETISCLLEKAEKLVDVFSGDPKASYLPVNLYSSIIAKQYILENKLPEETKKDKEQREQAILPVVAELQSEDVKFPLQHGALLKEYLCTYHCIQSVGSSIAPLLTEEQQSDLEQLKIALMQELIACQQDSDAISKIGNIVSMTNTLYSTYQVTMEKLNQEKNLEAISVQDKHKIANDFVTNTAKSYTDAILQLSPEKPILMAACAIAGRLMGAVVGATAGLLVGSLVGIGCFFSMPIPVVDIVFGSIMGIVSAASLGVSGGIKGGRVGEKTGKAIAAFLFRENNSNYRLVSSHGIFSDNQKVSQVLVDHLCQHVSNDKEIIKKPQTIALRQPLMVRG